MRRVATMPVQQAWRIEAVWRRWAECMALLSLAVNLRACDCPVCEDARRRVLVGEWHQEFDEIAANLRPLFPQLRAHWAKLPVDWFAGRRRGEPLH